MPGLLIDTHVLVYAFDQNDTARQDRAVLVLGQLELRGIGRLSVQALAEFFSASTRRLQPALTAAEALGHLDMLARAFPILPLTPQVVLEAARGVRDHRLNYWDAQVWAMARLNQIPTVLSEDFSAGAMLEGVRFVNPFAPEFDLEGWTGI
ncbi:MAG: PIN domain-containing protein [Chloroflexi bacterium]|nr:PIN domain-containing protein [Chloroflexota bacterium]